MDGTRMKRLLAISLAALVLSVGALSTPVYGDQDRPKCGDIIGSSQQSYYQVDAPGNTPHEAILSITILTAEPLCKNATLTVNVSTDGTTFVAYTYPGDSHFSSCGASCLTFTLSFGSTASAPSQAPPVVRVFLETATGNHVSDRAPNVGSLPFVLCDHDITTTDFDSTGAVIEGCGSGEQEGFQ